MHGLKFNEYDELASNIDPVLYISFYSFEDV